MGNNSKTLSEEKSFSLSSNDSIRRNCVSSQNNNNDNLQTLQKPQHLDLKITNSPGKTSLVKLGNNNNNNKYNNDESSSQSHTSSSFRRKVEQHPCANTRIHQRKPRLCREFSMNDELDYQHYSSGEPQFSMEMNEYSHRPQSFELISSVPVISQHYLGHDHVPSIPPPPPPPLLTKRSTVSKSGVNYFNLT